MGNPVTTLTELAIAVANHEPTAPEWRRGWSSGDAVIDQLAQLDFLGVPRLPAFRRALEELRQDPELERFLPLDGQPDPFITSATGGSRVDFEGVVAGLITNASRQLLIQQIERTDTALVRAVLESYEEIRRAAHGEDVRAYQVRGLTGLSLEPGAQIQTPWGTIRGIAIEQSSQTLITTPRLQTTALLVTPQLVRLAISREQEPPTPEVDQAVLESGQRIGTLTPLLFALASVDTELFAPVTTFETTILPIMAGLSWSTPLSTNPFIPTRHLASSEIEPIEDLAHTLAANYDENLQLASFRTVQAISHRADRSDALIDAVMAWESLVGTRSETVYRVTTALTRLLEPEVEKRRQFRKDLQGIYDTRSRVVHGDVVEPQKIQADSEEAIRISLRAMLELYRRGGEWLSMSSKERSESLILSDGQAA